MSPKSLLSAIRAIKPSATIKFSPVLPHHIGYSRGARIRVAVGSWNFDKSFFISYSEGIGSDAFKACLACKNDMESPPIMNEDEMMLGYWN